jgi:DnaJ-class molecular chaperone
LRGHGLPKVGGGDDTGELYATVDVAIPQTLSDQERAHYQALAALEKEKPKS